MPEKQKAKAKPKKKKRGDDSSEEESEFGIDSEDESSDVFDSDLGGDSESDESSSEDANPPPKTKKRTFGDFTSSQEEFGKFTKSPGGVKQRKLNKGKTEETKKFLKTRQPNAQGELEEQKISARPSRVAALRSLQNMKAMKATKDPNDFSYY